MARLRQQLSIGDEAGVQLVRRLCCGVFATLHALMCMYSPGQLDHAWSSLSLPLAVPFWQAKEALLPSFDLAGVAQLIQSGKAKRIICMCGAGISVSAGEHRGLALRHILTPLL